MINETTYNKCIDTKETIAPEVPVQEQSNEEQFKKSINESGKFILTRPIPIVIGPLENQ